MKRKNWLSTRLGSLIEIKHGWPFKSEYMTGYLPGRPIVVGIGNFEYSGGFRFGSSTIKAYTGDYPKEYILKPGDILLVMTCQTAGGEILGIPGRIPDDEQVYLHNQRMGKVVVKDRNKVDINFLYYLFLTKNFNYHLAATATGTKILHTAPERIEAFKFLLPPIAIQHTIASILSAYDDLIENNTRRIAILEEMAHMLYQEWFVKFCFPGHEKNTMVESELGMIPEGWEVVKLGEIADINKTSIKKGFEPLEINYVDINSVSIGIIETTTHMLFADAPGRARRLVKHGDIIWSTVRPNRKSYSLIVHPGINTIVSTGFAVISAKKVSYTYLYEAVTTEDFVSYLTNHATGAAYPAVNTNDFQDALVLLPPNTILYEFHELTANSFEQKHNLQRRNANLRRTRDLLLPRLISGEIDVSSWVEKNEEVMQDESISAAHMGDYDVGETTRRVAELNAPAPIERNALRTHSLWD